MNDCDLCYEPVPPGTMFCPKCIEWLEWWNGLSEAEREVEASEMIRHHPRRSRSEGG